MPNTTSQESETQAEDPSEGLNAKADALYRASQECCRQHERFSEIAAREQDETELTAAQRVVELSDQILAEMTEAYERAGERTRPDDEDDEWWHKANALWHASREYIRRHEAATQVARSLARDKSAEKLAELTLDYELEASALLGLRHALDAYRKTCEDRHR